MNKHYSEWNVPGEGGPRWRATTRMRDTDREETPDLTATSEGELREWLKQLSEEEREISYRRRVNQGRVDLMRAGFVRRCGVAFFSLKEWSHVLLGGQGPEGEGSSGGAGPSAGSPGSGGGG